ncbi:MAG TPA: site-specific integrase, partial [Ideonella sp.]|uniref:site-specific integrase n=1 Tax=Ideonella sp. TaxID=1929293 RepID=UPI002E32B44A
MSGATAPKKPRLGRPKAAAKPVATDPLIDAFVSALWVEDGLAANTLAAYRRDLSLFAQWLATTDG